jgi:hypothetical protein
MQELISLHPGSSLLLVGDFTRFNIVNFFADSELFQLVTESIRGLRMLDLCYSYYHLFRTEVQHIIIRKL